MNRKIIIVFSTLLLLTGFFIYQNSIKKTNSNQNETAEKISQNVKQLKEQSENYKIEINYPEFSPLNSQTQNINKSIIILVDEPLKNFKDSLNRNSFPPDLKNTKSEFSIKYEIPKMDDKIISIQFTSSEYLTGQAHPLSTFMVFNYSLKQNTRLKISDLFKKDSNYLQTLSEITFQKLHDHFAEDNNDFDDFIKSGTESKKENFEKFILKKDSLQILFDPYQVAPYVAGPQVVDIPFSEIAGLLNQDLLN